MRSWCKLTRRCPGRLRLVKVSVGREPTTTAGTRPTPCRGRWRGRKSRVRDSNKNEREKKQTRLNREPGLPRHSADVKLVVGEEKHVERLGGGSGIPPPRTNLDIQVKNSRDSVSVQTLSLFVFLSRESFFILFFCYFSLILKEINKIG